MEFGAEMLKTEKLKLGKLKPECAKRATARVAVLKFLNFGFSLFVSDFDIRSSDFPP